MHVQKSTPLDKREPAVTLGEHAAGAFSPRGHRNVEQQVLSGRHPDAKQPRRPDYPGLPKAQSQQGNMADEWLLNPPSLQRIGDPDVLRSSDALQLLEVASFEPSDFSRSLT